MARAKGTKNTRPEIMRVASKRSLSVIRANAIYPDTRWYDMREKYRKGMNVKVGVYVDTTDCKQTKKFIGKIIYVCKDFATIKLDLGNGNGYTYTMDALRDYSGSMDGKALEIVEYDKRSGTWVAA